MVRRAMAEYYLDPIEEWHKKDPESYLIRPKAERMSLQPGDRAKVCFLCPGEDDVDDGERLPGESMWVEVQTVFRPGKYQGWLRNQPLFLPYAFGDTIFFGAEHIYEIGRQGEG